MTMSAIRNVSLAVAGLALLAGCQTSSTAPGASGGAQELAAAYYACMLDAYAASPNAGKADIATVLAEVKGQCEKQKFSYGEHVIAGVGVRQRDVYNNNLLYTKADIDKEATPILVEYIKQHQAK